MKRRDVSFTKETIRFKDAFSHEFFPRAGQLFVVREPHASLRIFFLSRADNNVLQIAITSDACAIKIFLAECRILSPTAHGFRTLLLIF